MAILGRSVLTLLFVGDDLNPEAITKLLGVNPAYSARKGDVLPDRRSRIAKTGLWGFRVEDREPGDLNGQIGELFGALPSDLAVWSQLNPRFDGELFCGLFMNWINEGVDLEPEVLGAISARKLHLAFDIYGPGDDDDD